MRFESSQFFFDLIEEFGLQASLLKEYRMPTKQSDKAAFWVPEEHRRIWPLTQLLYATVSPVNELIMLPTAWGIWYSDNWHLYSILRTASGDSSSLKELPCHCFGENERELALDYLYLFFLFSWDVYIFGHHKQDLVHLSHDGFGTYYSPHRINQIAKAFADFGLEDAGLSAGNLRH